MVIILTNSLIHRQLWLLKTQSNSFQALWSMLQISALPLDHLISVRHGLISFSKSSFLKEILNNQKDLISPSSVIEKLLKLQEVKLGLSSLLWCQFSNNFQKFLQSSQNCKLKMQLAILNVSKWKKTVRNKSKTAININKASD